MTKRRLGATLGLLIMVATAPLVIYCLPLHTNSQVDDTTADDLTVVQTPHIATTAGIPMTFGVDPSLTLIVSTVAATTSCGTETTAVTDGLNLSHPTATATHPIVAQNLNVSTNAPTGYTVYVSVSPARPAARSRDSNANNTELLSLLSYAMRSTNPPSNAVGPPQGNKWSTLTSSGTEIMHNTTISDDTNCIAFQMSQAAINPTDTNTPTIRYSVLPVY